tara:strand:+ start:2625 stop:2792 length:168 start_codon:yes stop_codon:yes gene_type:complete
MTAEEIERDMKRQYATLQEKFYRAEIGKSEFWKAIDELHMMTGDRLAKLETKNAR